MSRRRRFKLALAFAGLALPVGAFALGLRGGAVLPHVDALTMPAQALRSADGSIVLKGLVSVSSTMHPRALRVQLPELGHVAEFPVHIDARSGTFPITLRLARAVAPGTLTYELSLVDAAGNVSAPVQRTVEVP